MITTVRHPKTGETFAVEIESDTIIRAAGPLSATDPTDWGHLDQALANAGDDAADDGAWLQAEIDRTK